MTVTRTTEQAAIDSLIAELQQLRDNASSHSMFDNARNLASHAARTLDTLASIATTESGLDYNGDWADFNDPIQDSVADAFYGVEQLDRAHPYHNPNKGHEFGHRQYGLAGA